MYCSACGMTVGQGLSYCNYCGAKLSGTGSESLVKAPVVKPGSVVWAMVAVFVFGLAAIMSLMSTMKRLDLYAGQILALTLLSFLIMLLLEGVFIWLLLRPYRSIEMTGAAALPKGPATKELGAAQPQALPEPVPSVTEHTTRTFEPVYSERKSK